ncbi:MAG: BlaI/MecI/CopY family transcriptional regulator [Bryobacterales bacterium]|nr:BlaI/MecI/CopY family transcriptional regulator [Bryobacterales bacterium]
MEQPDTPDLGELEQLLMQHVWAMGSASAEQCREALLPERPLKDSTIRTVLRRLEEKGLLEHTVDGRTYVYRPVAPAQHFAARAVRQIAEKFCGGSVEKLLIGMVDSEMLGEDEIERLARRIEAARKAKPEGGR